MTRTEGADNSNLSVLLELESMARRAETDNALHFLIVNETRKLLNYRQAILLSGDNKVEAVSSLSVVDRNAPMVTWLETFISEKTERDICQIDSNELSENEQTQFREFSFQHVVLCPLRIGDRLIGKLWLARETAWQPNELILIERLAETYAHAWSALLAGDLFKLSYLANKKVAAVIVAGLFLVSLFPVRVSTIAPAEIIPLDPMIVSAPIDGVIHELPVAPNTLINRDDVLFRYEDTNLRNGYEIALQARNVATARLRQASQGAFGDDSSRGRVVLLRAELDLKETELAYALELLNQVEVKAEADGLLVYSEASDWVGKPVAVGERVMEIVDPDKVQFRISLPVDDAIVLTEGSEVEVFLHAEPLTSIQASITRTSYNAHLTPENNLAYRIDAAFVDEHPDARIGLQGSARVYGEQVSLFFYVFRRPISTLRQFFGV
ncbi:MAG: HlyD family efflux transporter periplasmic adaptor subunit [Pseudomonadales bacterium]|nr:HlyD family efflux transporter periplasmic adaptor subunit [Pseudomonadales bacterium]MBO6597114.1 HlyD family efflux transporter periplasmic adaptor subunit [Pseudomonadales bacterium]MBO6823699.1 HlyD family efflux transporter periplasmic adaptor subunit [Pseudomonadales bacterium]